jgi:outer membrane protein assembly factor BamB
MREPNRRTAVHTVAMILATVLLGIPLSVAAPPADAPRAGRSPTDWPQWRGPNRDNVSRESGLLKEWPKDGPPLAWKAKGLGGGYSSVSIAGDRIYTMGDAADGGYVHALELDGGKKVWSTKVGRPGGDYPGTRSTPTVDGDRVYALGQWGDVACLDAASGQVKWKKNLERDFGGRMMSGWGYAE